MRRRHVLTVLAVLAAVYGGYFLVCAGPSGPPDQASVDPAPESGIAPFDEALTFARLGIGEAEHTLLLVVDRTDTEVIGIDLGPRLGTPNPDAFDALSAIGRDALVRLAQQGAGTARAFPLDRLLPAATGGEHIAFGTNFVEHGEEVDNEGVFAFPKYAVPTPAVVTLPVDRTEALFDYEAELCMRFDRDIRSLEDFDDATKAVFLCGDFTDRATLLRGLPAYEERLSGLGFSDAKSGPGRLPTGPFVVIPNDWRSFVSGEIITTALNGTAMQYGSGAEMILDFRQMAAFVLESRGADRWNYRGEAVPLAEGGVIRKGMVLLSGTPAGILFRPPTTKDIGCGAVAYVCLAGFLSFGSPRDYVIDRYIRDGLESERFLQPGDAVRHGSRRLGTISAEITAGPS